MYDTLIGNVRILDGGDVLSEESGFITVGRRMKSPIKVAFYSAETGPMNYPFLIENPGSVRGLREKYFFSGRILLSDGTSTRECSSEDVIDGSGGTVVLIERGK